MQREEGTDHPAPRQERRRVLRAQKSVLGDHRCSGGPRWMEHAFAEGTEVIHGFGYASEEPACQELHVCCGLGCEGHEEKQGWKQGHTGGLGPVG